MKIEFFNLKTGEPVVIDTWGSPTYFVLNGYEVWKDNEYYTESQEATVGFEDFIVQCHDIGWRVIK